MARLHHIFLRVLGLLAAAGPAHAEPVSLESLLREMTDREALARFPDPPYTARQFSSYDRASVSPDQPETWFANGDVNQYLRVEEVAIGGSGASGAPPATRREWVMADMAGPGAVVRIWSANPKGVMRVYLDGEAKPVIEAPMQEVLGGTWKLGDQVIGPPLAQESSRGFNLYLPIPYAKHCKITSDSDGFYYQVNYRTYKSGVVETFSPGAVKAMSHVNLVPNFDKSEKPRHQNADVDGGAGSGTTRVRPGGKGLINGMTQITGEHGKIMRQMSIKLFAGDMPRALRQTVLVAEFDGERCIWCPVGDFFGATAGITAFRDHYREVEADGWMRSAFVMPARKSFNMYLLNLGDHEVTFSYSFKWEPMSWTDNTMYFHAAWRGEYPIHALGGRGTMDWNYVEIQGQGAYVGDNLSVMNPVPEWWGEGDEKIYVDGETFPSHFGTGTEDYYGYAWCSPQLFQHPFHSQVRCDGNGKNNWGHTSVTRVRALDAIPFQKSLKFDMEVWHWKECDVAYAATTYWYARPGSTSNRLTDEAIAAMTAELKKPIPQPPPLPPPFKIEGAIECEQMKVLSKSDGLNVVSQDMDGFGRGTWSGDAQLWVQGRRPGDFIELEIPAPPADGIDPQHLGYAVKLHATASWDYGIVRFLLNGRASGSQDLFSGGRGQVRAIGPIDLGTARPVDGRLRLQVEVMGGNRAAEGTRSFFGLDCVTLEPRDLAPLN